MHFIHNNRQSQYTWLPTYSPGQCWCERASVTKLTKFIRTKVLTVITNDTLRKWLYGHLLTYSFRVSELLPKMSIKIFIIESWGERSILTLSPTIATSSFPVVVSTSTTHFSLTSLLSILFVLRTFFSKILLLSPYSLPWSLPKIRIVIQSCHSKCVQLSRVCTRYIFQT